MYHDAQIDPLIHPSLCTSRSTLSLGTDGEEMEEQITIDLDSPIASPKGKEPSQPLETSQATDTSKPETSQAGPAKPPQQKPAPNSLASPAAVASPTERPGVALSQGAVDKRFRRIFQPRADGTYLVSEEFVKQFKSKGADREQLLLLFEKCDYSPDCR